MSDQVDTGKLRIWEPLIMGLACAVGLLVGYNINFDNNDRSLLLLEDASPISRSDGRIEEVLRFVESTYVDSIDSDKISLALINEMLDELDPFSSYVTQEDLSEHNERLKGRYKGIGVKIISINDTFYVAQTLESSPAYNQLFVGTAIMAINNVLVSGNETAYETVQEMLKDSADGRLELDVIHVAEPTIQKVKLQITDIIIPSANLVYKLNENTGYLKLSRFSGNTYEQFIESIEQVKDEHKPLNLVLDLRSNPGGYLPEAIKVLSQLFEQKDKLLTYTEGLNRKKAEYRSTGKAFYNIKKIAVLINDQSASASEIIAGAIQDWDRGMIIGQKSYGKGLVQEIFPLKNGGALRLTVAKYYTPSGRLIQRSYSSEVNAFEADSLQAKTKLLERTMDSGNGIAPDILIDGGHQEDCYDYYYYMDNYVIKRMLELQRSTLKRTDFDQKAFENFIFQEYDEPINGIPLACKKELNQELYNAYLRMTMDEIDFAKQINVTDPYIEEAVKFVTNSKPTIALLPNKD